MKVVLLAGGLGTRLSEYTNVIPKPMVRIGKYPILVHLINIFKTYGYNDFIIAAGYKKEVIIDYFKKNNLNVNIKIINTGKSTMTGGRLLKLKRYLMNQTFLLTYGDGLSNINIKSLVNFHLKHKKMITVTAVRPPARFGNITMKYNKVINFKEKTQMSTGWINGGFFVINSNFFKYLKNHKTILEKEPLEKVSEDEQLYAYKHRGFWACMDTKRDKDYLEDLISSDRAFWINEK